MPQCLKEAGYNTAIIGKWHLGHADMKYWPRQRGFDYQYGAMIGELDYYTHSDAGVLDWFRNNKPVREKGYTTQLIGNDAVKYINEQSADKPFYLYLAFNAPHTPYQAPQEYVDRYPNIADPTRRTYAGMVTCLDDEIGRVVAALDKKGLRDNTLIVFQSDNGGTRNAMFAGVRWRTCRRSRFPATTAPIATAKVRSSRAAAAWLRLRQLARPHQARHHGGRDDSRRGHVSDARRSRRRLDRQMPAARRRECLGHHQPKASRRRAPKSSTTSSRSAAPLREGDWKLIWRTLIPTSVDLYNLADDPYETEQRRRRPSRQGGRDASSASTRWARNPPSRSR